MFFRSVSKGKICHRLRPFWRSGYFLLDEVEIYLEYAMHLYVFIFELIFGDTKKSNNEVPFAG